MTPEQRLVLAHVVVDPDAWEKHVRVYAVKAWNQDVDQLSRAREKLAAEDNTDSMAKKLDGILAKQKELTDKGPEPYFEKFLTEKVARWKPEYDREVVKPGYKNRAIRQAEDDAKVRAEAEAAALRKAESEAARKAEEDARVAALVEKAIVARAQA